MVSHSNHFYHTLIGLRISLPSTSFVIVTHLQDDTHWSYVPISFVELVHDEVVSDCSKYVNHSRLDSYMSSETHEENGYGHDDLDMAYHLALTACLISTKSVHSEKGIQIKHVYLSKKPINFFVDFFTHVIVSVFCRNL